MDRNVLDFLMRRVREDDRRKHEPPRSEYEHDMRMRDMGGHTYLAHPSSHDYGSWNAHGDYSDGRDYRDYRDYHHSMPLKLTREDMRRWEAMMANTDGTRGKHYDMSQVVKAAEEIGVQFEDYDEREFCLAVNMMYSDYGHLMKKHSTPQEKLVCCAEMAKAFLEDPDGPSPSEKLALYFHCIVDSK